MRYHEFAAIAVRHVVRHAEFIQQPVARDAMPGFQCAARIINSRMNHAAVASARAHAQPGHLLNKKDIAPPPRNSARHGAPHNAAADDNDVREIHGKQNR